jgi:hypothetical protein
MTSSTLSVDDRLNLEREFSASSGLIDRQWEELAGLDPELYAIIGREALRLFPEVTATRERALATRLALEAIHAVGLAELRKTIGNI